MKKFRIIGLLLALAIAALPGCAQSSPGYGSSGNAASSMSRAPAMAGGDVFSVRQQASTAPMEAPMYEEDAVDMAANPAGGGGIAAYETAPSQTAAAPSPDSSARKHITTVELQLQTRDYDAGVSRLEALCLEYGGFVQNSYVEGKSLYEKRGFRTANFSLRIPASALNDFTRKAGEEYNILYTREYVDDITNHYYDTQARLDSLRIRAERLTEMLKEATELQYLLAVDQELAQVRYEIESLTAQLTRMDQDVAFCTLNIMLEEVVEYDALVQQPATFGEKISDAFAFSWQDFVIFLEDTAVALVMALPFILLLVALAGVYLLLRGRRKKRKAAAFASRKLSENPSPVLEDQKQDQKKNS